jgi:hypothetical protein
MPIFICGKLMSATKFKALKIMRAATAAYATRAALAVATADATRDAYATRATTYAAAYAARVATYAARLAAYASDGTANDATCVRVIDCPGLEK